ncbi:MAG: DUF3035 domain-containing protein, partial [Rickettsiales bacterium]|nr:DUF3035 domain-containing protein [Rickettsiales bacterium]
PPEPGAPDLSSQNTESEAESLIINKGEPDPFIDNMLRDQADTALDPMTASDLEEVTPESIAAESAFMSSIGADKADENIRELIYEESIVEEVEEDTQYPLQDWLGIVTDDDEIVNPKAEAERIRANKDEGKPANEGEVETMDSDGGPINILDSIF